MRLIIKDARADEIATSGSDSRLVCLLSRRVKSAFLLVLSLV